NLHRRAIDRAASLNRTMDPAANRHMCSEKRDCRSQIADFRLRRTFRASFTVGPFHQSAFCYLESFRMPVRLRDWSFAFVVKRFVDGLEDSSGPTGFKANIEVELVFEKSNVAVPDHAEEPAGHFEIVGM